MMVHCGGCAVKNRTAVIVLAVDEPLQDLLAGPAGHAPRVVVLGSAPMVQRRIGRRAAAQQLPARQVHLRRGVFPSVAAWTGNVQPDPSLPHMHRLRFQPTVMLQGWLERC